CARVRGEQRAVVVRHLLEVRDEPPFVGRVTVEAAADLVEYSSLCHRIEALDRDAAGPVRAGVEPVVEQQVERARVRELRCLPEAAVAEVEALRQLLDRLIEKR